MSGRLALFAIEVTLRSVTFDLLLLSLLLAGCSDTTDPPFSPAGTGGTSAGGSSAGGAVSAGGSPATGGVVATGGTSSGGAVAAGGSGGAQSGGADAAGGSTGGVGTGGDEGSGGTTSLEDYASALDGLFMHDACTGVQEQADTCTHVQLIEEKLTFGGDPDTTYELTLRVRGLFEPTNISGGTAPLSEHPYFVVGGTVAAGDYSQWHIVVSEPAETYYLNHYPQTSHTIYQEDFEASILVQGGAEVTVRVEDANDREIDNGTSETGHADRHQLIEGVTDEVLDGQCLRLDVVSVTAN